MWMRRTGIAAIVAALVVLIGAPPAFAAGPPPGPVDPSDVLPSQAVRMVQGSGGTWSVGDYLRAFTYANRSSAVATVPKVVPLTAPAPVPGLAAKAGLLGFAYTAGVAGGTAGLKIVGMATGTDYDNAMCGAEQWLQTTQAIITLGLGAACNTPFVEPNADVTVGVSLSYGGSVLTAKGVYTDPYGTRAYCWMLSGTAPTGVTYQMTGPSGPQPFTMSVGPVAGSTSSGATALLKCRQGYGSTGAGSYSATMPSMNTGYLFSQGTLRLVNTTTQQVVATSVSAAADPLRDSKCTLTWEDGTTTEGFVGQYRESEGFPIGVVDTACTEAFTSKPGAGPDLLPQRISIGSTNTETGAKTEIAGQDVPDFSETERKGLTPGDNTGLRLLKITATGLDSCMTWAADCASWWTQSSSGTNEDTYKCVYGGQPVSLTECGIYRYTFDTKTNTPTITDPQTGESVEWGSSPSSGNSTSPGGAGDVAPGAKCMSEWGSAPNPLEWVFTPIKCALVWAFVPRQSEVSATVTALGAAAGSVALVDPLLTLVEQLPQSSGCEGIPFDLTFFGTAFHGRILAACEGETRAVATVVNGLLALVIITGAVIAVTRYAAAVFGFVGPGGSMEQTQRQTERIIERSGKGGG